MYSWKGLKLYVRINTRICVIGEGKRVCSQYIGCQHYILTHRTLTHSPHNHSICILFSLCSSSFLYKSIHKDYLYLSRFVCVCPSTGMKDPASCSFCRSVSVCVCLFSTFLCYQHVLDLYVFLLLCCPRYSCFWLNEFYDSIKSGSMGRLLYSFVICFRFCTNVYESVYECVGSVLR